MLARGLPLDWQKEVEAVNQYAPVVKTDRHRNRFRAQTGAAPNNAEQPKRCNEFAKELTATVAGVMREL